MSRAVAAAAVLAATILSGCATPAGDRSGDDTTSVGGIVGEWQLTKGGDADGSWPVNGIPVTLVISDDAVTGRAPCNSYTGGLTVAGSDLSIDAISSTEVACADAARTRLETRYLAALARVTTVQVDGPSGSPTLTLSGPDETLRFSLVDKKSAN